MTTTAASQFLDFEVPDELPESSSGFVGRVTAIGAQLPPARMVAKSNNSQPHFHQVIQTLSIKYDSDMTMFEDNDEHVWTPMYNAKGQLQGPQSNFGEVKAAYAKLGFPITNSASAQAIVGKVFSFVNRKKTINFKKLDSDGNTVDDPRDTWLVLPVALEEDTWQPTGPVTVIPRPRNKAGAVPSAANSSANDAEVLPQLGEVLLGQPESQYFTAMVTSGNTTINVQPYITDASNNPAELTRRLAVVGYHLVDGVLSK